MSGLFFIAAVGDSVAASATSLTTIMRIMMISAGESGVDDSNYKIQSLLIFIFRVS